MMNKLYKLYFKFEILTLKFTILLNILMLWKKKITIKSLNIPINKLQDSIDSYLPNKYRIK